MTGSTPLPPEEGRYQGAGATRPEATASSTSEPPDSYWARTKAATPGVHPQRRELSTYQPARPYHSPIPAPGGGRGARGHGSGSGVSASSVVLFLCAIGVIIGSLTPWLTLSVAGHSVSADGNQAGLSTLMGAGVNGWFTFVGGIVLLVLGALMMALPERAFRQLAVIMALATFALAAYDMSRVAYDISRTSSTALRGTPANLLRVLTLNNHLSVGFGLIVLLAAAFVSLFAAAAALRSD